MNIRKAVLEDVETLMAVFENARKIMRDSGNLHQWNDGYPSKGIVEKDILNGNCYVCCEDEDITGTMALIPGPEPTYAEIEGSWPDEAPYFVIHRIAAVSPGKGMAKHMLDWAFNHISDECSTIRIDTHRDNRIMKHVLTKYGFTPCGVIHLADGAPRDAFIYTYAQRMTLAD